MSSKEQEMKETKQRIEARGMGRNHLKMAYAPLLAALAVGSSSAHYGCSSHDKKPCAEDLGICLHGKQTIFTSTNAAFSDFIIVGDVRLVFAKINGGAATLELHPLKTKDCIDSKTETSNGTQIIRNSPGDMVLQSASVQNEAKSTLALGSRTYNVTPHGLGTGAQSADIEVVCPASETPPYSAVQPEQDTTACSYSLGMCLSGGFSYSTNAFGETSSMSLIMGDVRVLVSRPSGNYAVPQILVALTAISPVDCFKQIGGNDSSEAGAATASYVQYEPEIIRFQVNSSDIQPGVKPDIQSYPLNDRKYTLTANNLDASKLDISMAVDCPNQQ